MSAQTEKEAIGKYIDDMRRAHAEEIAWRDQRIERLEELLDQLANEVDRLTDQLANEVNRLQSELLKPKP